MIKNFGSRKDTFREELEIAQIVALHKRWDITNNYKGIIVKHRLINTVNCNREKIGN